MSQKKNKQRDRQIGKKQVQKRPLIDPRYKNLFWTTIIVIILIIFFIINNTRYVPDQGPYPPNYDPAKHEHPDSSVSHDLYGFGTKDTNSFNQ
jgi:hypothetical protein